MLEISDAMADPRLSDTTADSKQSPSSDEPTSYPSPPASDVDPTPDNPNNLPTQLEIDPDRLVRSTRIGATRGRASTSAPKPRPTLTRSKTSQLEIATTIQTIPQETGFWSILGPFLIDMSLEVFGLTWFFMSHMVAPKLWSGLVIFASPVLVSLMCHAMF